MRFKKLISGIVVGSMLMCGSVFAMSSSDFDNGVKKGNEYFSNGLYYEARDEFQWFCDANWYNMTTEQQKCVCDYINNTNAKIEELARSIDYEAYIKKYIKEITEFTNGNVYVKFTFGYVNGDAIPDAIVSTSDSHVGAVRFFVSLNNDVKKVTYDSEYGEMDGFGQFGKAEYIPYESKVYSYLMYRGVETSNYYAINTGKATLTNDKSGKYISTPEYVDMYSVTDSNIRNVFYKTLESEKSTSPVLSDNNKSENVSQFALDTGISKGIEYYNKGLYYEAIDEFQWFCDANWYKMDSEQQKYVVDYINKANAKLNEWIAKNDKSAYNGYFSGGGFPYYSYYYKKIDYIGKWHGVVKNATASSIVFGISQGESDYYTDAVTLYRQSNGSYKGTAYSSWGTSYLTVWLETPDQITVTVSGNASQIGTKTLYRTK